MLGLDLLLGSAFVLIQTLEDIVAALSILVDDAIIDNQVDAFLGQVIQLLPVAGGVERLVLDGATRILLSVAPLALKNQFLDKVWLILAQSLHFSGSLLIHTLIIRLVLEQLAFELALLLAVESLS